MLTKPQLRAHLRTRPLPPGALRAIAPSALDQLLSFAIAPPRAILVFAPLLSEPDIAPLARAALAHKLPLAAPRLHPADCSMSPALISNWDVDFAPSPSIANLLEPRADRPPVPPERVDLALIPALAFDRLGNRLGRGAGYYDRFLARLLTLNPRARFVGVCFDHQILPLIPTDPHDVPVHALLTPLAFLPTAPPENA